MSMDLFVMGHRCAREASGSQRLALMHNIKTALHADEPRFIRIEYLNVIVKIGPLKQQVIHNNIAAQLREGSDGSAHRRQHSLSIITELDVGDTFSIKLSGHHI